jgi:hypothetical protein
MPEPGTALALSCAAAVALAALALKAGRPPREVVAWAAVLLVGVILAIVWL